MSIEIITPGLLTTVQDLGRRGYMGEGFVQCGALDTDSMKAANILVGNARGAAVLEMTMTGICALIRKEITASFTGADMQPICGGAALEMNRAYRLRAGETLTLSPSRAGCRCYMAVRGGFDVPECMGSRSTDLKAAVGGFHGRGLRAGDILHVCDCEGISDALLQFRHMKYTPPPGHAVLRAVRGPQTSRLTEEGYGLLFSSVYTVTPDCDRMGIRLSGAAIPAEGGYEIISDGCAPGSVQLPPSGEPVLLLADRQTTGGYAKAVTVISADIPLAAQLRPGDTVRFEETTVRKARAAALKKERMLKRTERLM